jgi:hypothetical protein
VFDDLGAVTASGESLRRCSRSERFTFCVYRPPDADRGFVFGRSFVDGIEVIAEGNVLLSESSTLDVGPTRRTE